MSSSPVQLPSPCLTNLDRGDSSPPDQKPTPSTYKMQIHSLLNPTATTSERGRVRQPSLSQPPTPAYTQASSVTSTPQPQTPTTPSPAKRQKLVKDAAIFTRGVAKQPVIYKPYECSENATCLTPEQQEELARQHDRFQIYPNAHGSSGFIADFQRHIPYSSDKKAFFGKTNRDAFEGMTLQTAMHIDYIS